MRISDWSSDVCSSDLAIVVLENISRHIERGLSPTKAALRGVREVGFTLVAMTVALSVVFVSILFMGGLVERLFREFSITLVAEIGRASCRERVCQYV